MVERLASCQCGALRAVCVGEPIRVSVCHCLACQRRSGSAFTSQARWPDSRVTIRGETRSWVRTADSGDRITFRFCPTCGSTIAYGIAGSPGVTAIPLGAFADAGFPPPRFSVYEHRKVGWVAILGEGIERSGEPAADPAAAAPGAAPSVTS